jgi:hypothetical protein
VILRGCVGAVVVGLEELVTAHMHSRQYGYASLITTSNYTFDAQYASIISCLSFCALFVGRPAGILGN